MEKKFDALSEVAEPRSGDERRFKAKHTPELVDDPNAVEHNFTATTYKFVNRGDLLGPLGKAVYEQEDITELVAHKALSYLRRGRAEIQHKIMDEGIEKIVVTPAGGDSDGDESHDNYKRKTAAEALPQAIKHLDPLRSHVVTPEGGDSDGDESHDNYKKRTAFEAPKPLLSELNAETLRKFYKRFRKDKNGNSMNEGVEAGSLQLNDKSSVTISDADAKLINGLLSKLNTANKEKLQKVLLSSKKGYKEILDFARGSVEK